MAVSRQERVNWSGLAVLRRARQAGTSTLQVPINDDGEWRALVEYLAARPWVVFDMLHGAWLRDDIVYWRLEEHTSNHVVVRAYTRHLDITIHAYHTSGEAEIIAEVTRPTITVTHRNTCTEV